MGLKLNATNGGGSVELDVPDTVNSDLALTVPATAGDIVVKGTDDSVDLGDVNIDSSGRLIVGTSTYAGNGKLVAAGNTGGSAGTLDITWTGSRPTAADTDLGYIRWYVAENSSSNAHYASIYASSDGASGGTGDIPGRLVFSTTADGASSPTERMRIDSTGHVYIGSATDLGLSNYAQSSGNGNFLYRVDNGSTAGSLIVTNNADIGWSLAYFNKFNWSSTDDGRYINFFKNGTSLATISLTSSGTVSYGTGSDYRLKENVTQFTDGITKLKQLQPKQFNMIDDPDNAICDGFLAHELQTVIPQAVTGVKDAMRIDEGTGEEVPDYQEIDYGKITPLLTAALQEAITKIETLEAKVAALEAAE